MSFLSVHDYAVAVGVEDRAARRHFAKGKYRGHTLPVVAIKGQQGGKGSRVLALRLDAASPELRELLGLCLPALETPFERAVKASVRQEQFDKQDLRREIIDGILATQPRSSERTAAYELTALRSGLAVPTLRKWVGQCEAKGQAALLPKLRSDRGKRRFLITGKWEKGAGLSPETMEKIAARLARRARSMIANDCTSAREVIRLSEFELQRLTAEASSQVPLAQLPALCKLHKKWVAPFERFRLVHIHDKDHKRWQDKNVPRIRRDLHPSPMALLMGDVHYMDILFECENEPVRVRLIAWLDMSSLHAWVTPVFLSKGKGIRQEDVAQSLAQATMCPYGGIPDAYYLDNGSEYAELPRLTSRLGVLANRVGGFGVTLAKAYSPQSKGDIENFFHILQGLYQSLPGYIGGDRTNKKSANKGKVVAPYRGTLAQL